MKVRTEFYKMEIIISKELGMNEFEDNEMRLEKCER